MLVLGLLHLAAALALILGYKARLASGLCWLLLTSLHWRNPLVELPEDFWLRLFLFWGMVLPWDQCWSRRPSAPPPEGLTWGLLCHVALALAVHRGQAPPEAYLPVLCLLPGKLWDLPPLRGLARRWPTEPGMTALSARHLAAALLLGGLWFWSWTSGLGVLTTAFATLGLASSPPSPPSDWTLVASGQRADGTRVDLSPVFHRPWARWERYQAHLAASASPGLGVFLARYLAYQWNEGESARRVSRVTVGRQRKGEETSLFATYEVPRAQEPPEDNENSLSRK
jgi:hypothetical protein